MIRIFGVMVISFSVVIIGFLKCLKLSSRVKFLELIKQFAFSCADDMRFSQKSVFDVLKKSGKNDLEFFKTLDAETLNNECKLIEILDKNGIDDSDKKIVCSFLLGLGTTDIDGQKLHCQYYYNCFDNLLKEAVEIQKEKGRIFKTIYLFAGITLFLILI